MYYINIYYLKLYYKNLFFRIIIIIILPETKILIITLILI